MVTTFQPATPVVYARRLPSGETEQVRLDGTVVILSPTGQARDPGDSRDALAAALAHWVQRATEAEHYAETIISGAPSCSPLLTIEEVPMR